MLHRWRIAETGSGDMPTAQICKPFYIHPHGRLSGKRIPTARSIRQGASGAHPRPPLKPLNLLNLQHQHDMLAGMIIQPHAAAEARDRGCGPGDHKGNYVSYKGITRCSIRA